MFIRFMMVPMLMLIPTGIYLYFYILRTMEFWGTNRKSNIARAISVMLSVLAVLWASNVFHIGAILVFHVTAMALCMELVHFVMRIAARGKNRDFWDKLYRCGLVPILATALILTYGYYNIKDVRETDYTIQSVKTMRPQGYRIAMISDLHFGLTMDEKKLAEYCKRMESKKPDMVVLCGDIVDDGTTLVQMRNAFHILGGMKSRYGTFYVFGNHDMARYSSSSGYSEAQLREAMADSGIHVLEDQIYAINKEFTILGRKDRGFVGDRSRMPVQELLNYANVDPNSFLLLLDHQPRELSSNSRYGIDLQLSGHTHGGQLWPIGLINDLTQTDQLNYGNEKILNYQIIVSSGIAGWGYPIRTVSHSEFVIVDVKGR